MTHLVSAQMSANQTIENDALLLSEDALDQVAGGDLFGVLHHTMGTVVGGILTVTGDRKNGMRLLTHQPQLLAKNVKELFN